MHNQYNSQFGRQSGAQFNAPQPQTPPKEAKRKPTPVEEAEEPYEEASKPTDRVKLLRNLIWVVPIIFATLALITGAWYVHLHNGSENVNAAREVLLRVAENIRTLPFYDIEQKAVNDACSAGFEELEIAEFGGVTGGCLCSDGSIKSRAYCALKAFSDSCAIVKSVPAQKLKKWDDKQFCVKRVQHFKHEHRNPCPTLGYKTDKCSTSYCIGTNDDCPYNTLSTAPVAFEERILEITHNHSHKEHSAFKTHAPTTADKVVLPASTPASADQPEAKIKYVAGAALPFIGLTVTTGTSQCYNRKFREKKNNEKSYPLLTIQETGCDIYNKIDEDVKISKQALYKQYWVDNGLGNAIAGLKFWDSFVDATNDHLSLLLVRKIQIKDDDDCLSVNPDDIEKVHSEISTLKSDIVGIEIAVLVLTGLSLLIAFVFYVFKDSVFKSFDFTKRSSARIHFIFGLIIAILVIAAGITYYAKNSDINRLHAEFQQYHEKKCFDNTKYAPINLALKTVNEYITESHGDLTNLVLIGFYSGIAFIVVMVVLLVLKHKTGTAPFESPFSN